MRAGDLNRRPQAGDRSLRRSNLSEVFGGVVDLVSTERNRLPSHPPRPTLRAGSFFPIVTSSVACEICVSSR